LTNKILVTIPTHVYEGQHIIGLPKKFHLDLKPIMFEVRINEKNQLVLFSEPLKPDKTNGTTLEVDNSE